MKAYGWLDKNAYRAYHGYQGGAGGGGLAPYAYGWPAGGTTESNVTCQWIFDEASGNLVDEVASLTIVPSAACLYGVDSSAYSGGMARSVHTDGGRKFTAAANSAWNVGATDDVVVEVVAQWPAAPSSGGNTESFFFDSRSSATTAGFALSIGYAVNGNINLLIYTDDATALVQTWTDPFAGACPTTTAAWTKFRLVLNRTSSLATLYLNGVSAGTKSIATVASKAFACTAVNIGGRFDAFRNGDNLYNELRLTVGNATNNSGGPSGG